MSTLSSITQTDKLKEVDKRWDARTVLEASSATTQCQNTIGKCQPSSCKCWICGENVYMDSEGNNVSNIIDVDPKLIPNCEHKLPIIQAFLILGGLYWAKEPPKKDSIITQNYAWSHAVCNIQKSDHIYFNDDGIKLGEIRTLLNTLWDHASFKPIQKRLINDGLTKDAWIRRQTGSMTQQIKPLYDFYKKGNSDGNYALNLLAGVSIPLSYYNDLVAILPQDSRLRQALMDYSPEVIRPLEVNEVLQGQGERERKMYIDPSQIEEVENACRDSRISEICNEFIGPSLTKMNERAASKSPQYKDKLYFLNQLLKISSGIENKSDSTFEGKYWKMTQINISLRDIVENTAIFQCEFFNKFLPTSGIADIIRDINLFLPNSLQKKVYLLEIVQTIFLFFLIDSSNKFRPSDNFMPEVLKNIEKFKKELTTLLASQLRILYTKEIYSGDQDERYFTTYILNKYTGNTFIEKIKGMLHAFPDIDQLVKQNIPPSTWNPNLIPQKVANILLEMAKETNALMSQAPAGASRGGGAKKKTKRKGKRKKKAKTRKQIKKIN